LLNYLILALLHLILTSNRVSCLFCFGDAEGGIEKNAEQIFFKEAKAAAFRLRSPPAAEANAMHLQNE
jgi:hypothetical protein